MIQQSTVTTTLFAALIGLAGSCNAGDAPMRNVGELGRAAIDGYGYGHQSNAYKEFVAVYCVDGYKYLMAGNRENFQYPALLQMREMLDGREVLARCRNQ